MKQMPIKKEKLKRIVIPSSMILIISLTIMVSLSIKENLMLWVAFLLAMDGILLIVYMIYSLLYRKKKSIFNQVREFIILLIVLLIINILLSIKGDLIVWVGLLFIVECIGWIMCMNEYITDINHLISKQQEKDNIVGKSNEKEPIVSKSKIETDAN